MLKQAAHGNGGDGVGICHCGKVAAGRGGGGARREHVWAGGTKGTPLVRRAGCRQPGRCAQVQQAILAHCEPESVCKMCSNALARAASLCVGGTRKPAAADLWADACVAIASRASRASFMAAKREPNRLGTIKRVAGRGVGGAGCQPTQFVEMGGDELTSNEPRWVPSMGDKLCCVLRSCMGRSWPRPRRAPRSGDRRMPSLRVALICAVALASAAVCVYSLQRTRAPVCSAGAATQECQGTRPEAAKAAMRAFG